MEHLCSIINRLCAESGSSRARSGEALVVCFGPWCNTKDETLTMSLQTNEAANRVAIVPSYSATVLSEGRQIKVPPQDEKEQVFDGLYHPLPPSILWRTQYSTRVALYGAIDFFYSSSSRWKKFSFFSFSSPWKTDDIQRILWSMSAWTNYWWPNSTHI